MTNKEHLLETQGYYYLVTLIWDTAPDRKFIAEYGNEQSAQKAVNHWNKYPGANATMEKKYA